MIFSAKECHVDKHRKEKKVEGKKNLRQLFENDTPFCLCVHNALRLHKDEPFKEGRSETSSAL
jgi:hypothetical protein